MKKFVFELQEILDFRKYEEQQAQNELGKALAVENEIQNNLNQIALQYVELKKRMKSSVDFADVISASQFSNLLKFQKEELLQQLSEAKLVTEEKRKILQEVMKKTTALEKMKEQQLDEYKAAEDHEETEFVDDLATMRHRL